MVRKKNRPSPSVMKRARDDGPCGWAPGQLETEIQHNGWLHCAADPDLVFGSAELLEARLHLAVARDDVLHLSFLLGIGHRRFELLQFARDDTDWAGAVHHFGNRAAAGHL